MFGNPNRNMFRIITWLSNWSRHCFHWRIYLSLVDLYSNNLLISTLMAEIHMKHYHFPCEALNQTWTGHSNLLKVEENSEQHRAKCTFTLEMLSKLENSFTFVNHIPVWGRSPWLPFSILLGSVGVLDRAGVVSNRSALCPSTSVWAFLEVSSLL